MILRPAASHRLTTMSGNPTSVTIRAAVQALAPPCRNRRAYCCSSPGPWRFVRADAKRVVNSSTCDTGQQSTVLETVPDLSKSAAYRERFSCVVRGSSTRCLLFVSIVSLLSCFSVSKPRCAGYENEIVRGKGNGTQLFWTALLILTHSAES